MSGDEYKNIKFTLEDGIAHLILARHDIRNAYSERDFTDEILDALAQVQVHPKARVLVISAEGSAFSAGGNIKDMKKSTFKRFISIDNFDLHLKLHRADCLASHGDLSLLNFTNNKIEELSNTPMHLPYPH